jgi:hypothetical protein
MCDNRIEPSRPAMASVASKTMDVLPLEVGKDLERPSFGLFYKDGLI